MKLAWLQRSRHVPLTALVAGVTQPSACHPFKMLWKYLMPHEVSCSRQRVHHANLTPVTVAPGSKEPAKHAYVQAAAAAAVMVSDGAAQRACPPCSVLVRITCLGGHEQMHLPCCEAQPRPCPRACGRQLACGSHFASGVHTCGKPCHVVSAPGALKEL